MIIFPLILSTPIFLILLNIGKEQVPWLILGMSIGGLAISLIGLKWRFFSVRSKKRKYFATYIDHTINDPYLNIWCRNK